MRPRIVAAFDNVNMGLAHRGLSDLARKHKIHFEKLEPGHLVLFLNRRKDRLKVVGNGGSVLAYLKLAEGQRLPVGAIQYIPATFTHGGRVDIDAAIAMHVRASFDAKHTDGEIQVFRKASA